MYASYNINLQLKYLGSHVSVLERELVILEVGLEKSWTIYHFHFYITYFVFIMFYTYIRLQRGCARIEVYALTQPSHTNISERISL
jgi:hypothetical protein